MGEMETGWQTRFFAYQIRFRPNKSPLFYVIRPTPKITIRLLQFEFRHTYCVLNFCIGRQISRFNE